MRSLAILVLVAAACNRDNGLHKLGPCSESWGSDLVANGQCERPCEQRFTGAGRPDGGTPISCKATNPVRPLSANGSGGDSCSDAFYTDDIYGDGQHIGCCIQAATIPPAVPTVRFFECCQSSGFGDGTPYECPE